MMAATSGVPILDAALIDEYEARLLQRHVPIERFRFGGMTDEEMDEAVERWHPGWLAIMGPQLPIVIDCSRAEHPQTPVQRFEPAEVVAASVGQALSLGQMVTWWIDAIDRGAWQWDSRRRTWRVEQRLLDRKAGLLA